MLLKEQLVIAAPCPVTWESMQGDERVRFCSGCSKNVYNLSDMSELELEEFLQANGANQCVRLFRRTDGKIMTDNCPRALRTIRNRWRKISQIASALIASICAFMPSARVQAQATGTGESAGDSKQKYKWVMPKEPYPGAWAAGGPRPMRVPIDGSEEQSNPKPKTTTITPPKTTVSSPQIVPKTDSAIQSPKNGDLSAFNKYSLAKASESSGNFLVAHTQYIEAIQIARKQKQADPKFEKELFASLNRLRAQQMHLPALDANSNLEMIKSLYPDK